MHFKTVHFSMKTQNLELVNLKYVTYAQPIPLSLIMFPYIDCSRYVHGYMFLGWFLYSINRIYLKLRTDRKVIPCSLYISPWALVIVVCKQEIILPDFTTSLDIANCSYVAITVSFQKTLQ